MNRKPADIRWLAVGALAGLAAAGFGLLRQSGDAAGLPDASIARVNGVLIGRDDFERARERTGTAPDDSAAAAALLQRLVDDELLVQRGVELGMTESDGSVRSAIIDSLVASITGEADAADPDDGVLETYLRDNPDQFRYISRMHVEAWQTDKEPVARAFVEALRAGPDPVDMADIEAVPDLPPGLMDVEILRNYLGPAITAALAEMPIDGSAVFARRGRWLVVRLVDREQSEETDLDAIRNRVLVAYRRHLADSALRQYVEGLRQRADIAVALP